MKVLGYAKAVVWVTSKLSIIQKSIETLKAGIKAFEEFEINRQVIWETKKVKDHENIKDNINNSVGDISPDSNIQKD
jgi:hypothetical protein